MDASDLLGGHLAEGNFVDQIVEDQCGVKSSVDANHLRQRYTRQLDHTNR